MSFQQYSKEILTEYLGTVAYVDDLIFLKKEVVKPVKIVNAPIREIAAKTIEEKIDTKTEPEVHATEKEPETIQRQLRPNINPSAFTNAFLEKGIHCSLFEIENDDDSLESLKKILRKSDVVILDWQMHQDDGKKASKLLLSVIESSQKPELRLFVIFTDDPNFANLLSDTIIPKLQKISITGDLHKSGCSFKFGHSKIITLKKTNGEKSENTVSDDELPDRIIEEFAEITSGLVSNSILKAVSVIRKNSHCFLETFNKDLDAAFFNHRAFLENPSDSELHMVNWISDEIKDMLYFNKVSKEMNIDNIKLLLNSHAMQEYPIFDKEGNEKKKLSKELMINILEKGCLVFNKENDRNGKNVPLTWFNHFHKSFASNRLNINEKFAALSSLSSSSFTHDAHQLLTLGVLLKDDEDILLCIQPSCDSFRLKKASNFIFLKVVKNNEKFDLVIPDGDKYLKLAILNKSDNILLISFNPNNGTVISSTIGKKEIFKDINEKKYEWMSNLKYPFAQRIINSFAQEISRVGLDESEWLRKS